MKPLVLFTAESHKKSVFEKLLSGVACEVMCVSFIRTQKAQVKKVPSGDWVFFSSPRSVRYYFEMATPEPNQKFAAVSKGTAKELSNYVLCSFEGKPDTKDSVQAFKELLNPGETVVIPHSDVSVKRLQQVLPKTVYKEFILYHTLPALHKLNRTPHVVVFTSPGNVSGYIQSGNPQPKKCVAIGETTAKELKKNRMEFVTSPGYTPLDLSRAVRSLLQ